MKRKFTFLMAAFMLLAFLAVPMGMRGQTRDSYSIAMKESSDGNESTTAFGNPTTITDYIGDGSNYVTSISSSYVYQAATNNGWKLGSSKNPGTFTLTLSSTAQALTLTSVVINAKNYSTDATTLTLTVTRSDDETESDSFSSLGGDFDDYTLTLSSPSTIKSITVSTNSGSKHRAYVHNIDMITSASGPTPLAVPTNFHATAGDGQAEFTWNAVSNASSYTISYTPQGGSEQTVTGITGTSRTITGLVNGTEYTCKIKAVGDGTTYTDSDYSSTITVTPTNTQYTVTLNAGNGTVNGETTISWNVSMNSGNLPDAVPQCNTWSFYGWSTAAASTQTTTAPTCVNGIGYTPTNNITLYAVYSKTESSGPAFNGTTSTGSFLIYATVSATNHYATGTGSKISRTTNASEATSYTFEQPSGYNSGEFAIKTGNDYITYSSSTNLGTSTNPYKWTISEGTKGTWRLTSETSGRGFIFRAGSSNVFGGYSTGNVTANGTEYYDLEIGGSSTTYYHSTPDCMETVATPTFDPAAGVLYTTTATIHIATTTADANIYYTLNEDEPTSTPSATNFLYNAATGVTISQATTIKAKAFKEGWTASETATASYTFQHDVAEPEMEGEIFTATPYEVIILVPNNTTVYYTTDGSTPTDGSDEYDEDHPFTINATTTVKAIAYDNDGCYSDVVTATYTRAYTLANAKALFNGSAVDNVTINLAGVQVIAQSSNKKYTYAQQDNVGLLIYRSGGTNQAFASGDNVTSGTVVGTIKKYGENLELEMSTATAFADIVKTTGTLTPSATDVTITNITGSFSTYESRYIALESLTMSLDDSKTLSDGTNTLTIYDQFSILGSATEPDDDVVVKGIVTSYTQNNNVTYQIVPIALADITTGVAATLPTLAPVGGATAAEAVTTDNVTVTPATSTTVTYQFGENVGEITSATVLTVPSASATALEVVASRDFYTDNTATYYYKTSVPTHDVTFYVNGTAATTLALEVLHGDVLGSLPTATAPNGYAFMGWTESTITGIQASAPTLVTSSTTVDDDMDLYAVFALVSESNVAYEIVAANVSNIVDGTYLIAVNKVNSANYNFANGSAGSGHAGVEETGVAVANSYLPAEIPEGAKEYTLSGNNTDGFSIHCSTGYLNGGSTKSSLSYGNSATETWTFSVKNDGFVLDGVTNESKMSCNSATAASAIRNYASTGNYYDPLYFFKKNVAANYSNYCTTVTILSGKIATATHPGACAIDETAGVLIESGVVLTAGALGNSDPDNLLIEEGGQLVVNNAVSGTMYKSVNHYTGDKDNYYLIASPVDNFVPAGDMIDNSFDLYYFDESQAQEEWQNYEANTFNLEIGKGYLYANNTDTDLEFAGELTYTIDPIDLANTSSNPFAGWNLIGNPYPCRVTINAPFYRISGNALATEATANTVAIEPMEAVFVQYDAANSITSITFTKAPGTAVKGNRNALNIMTRDNARQTTDNALICFGTGNNLHKFTLNPENAMVYIPQHGEEFAIVDSETRGEMPVNFKAAENGTYTISVEAENLDVNYLHLIDNITGMDVDLLATPSYTFEGKKTDYASRFRLVFDANAGNNEANEEFAFISDGDIIVNGTGTIQVIDILGRQMFSHEVNSAFRIQNSEFAPGVYVLRLINGNNVKTQKIVVK